MSVEGAVDVAYRGDYEAAADPQARRQELIAESRSRLGALRAAEHFHVDEVIDPRDTRSCLIRALEDAPVRRRAKGYARHRSISPI